MDNIAKLQMKNVCKRSMRAICPTSKSQSWLGQPVKRHWTGCYGTGYQVTHWLNTACTWVMCLFNVVYLHHVIYPCMFWCKLSIHYISYHQQRQFQTGWKKSNIPEKLYLYVNACCMSMSLSPPPPPPNSPTPPIIFTKWSFTEVAKATFCWNLQNCESCHFKRQGMLAWK